MQAGVEVSRLVILIASVITISAIEDTRNLPRIDKGLLAKREIPNGCPSIISQCPVPEKENATLLPNPSDCGSYCACSWGNIYLMPCPDTLFFNPVNHVCDWPASSGCHPGEAHTTDGTTLPPPSVVTDEKTDAPSTVTDRTIIPPASNGCQKVQDLCPVPENEYKTLLPNPNDCGSYCACNHGNIHMMHCPPGLYFNPKVQVCDWPELSGCPSNGTAQPSPAPVTKVSTEQPTPVTDQTTLPPSANGCEIVKDLCPVPEHENATLLPNPDDCGSYCACSNGEIYLMQCPTGLYFNPVLHVCDWPEPSGCNSNGTTHHPSNATHPPTGATTISNRTTNSPTETTRLPTNPPTQTTRHPTDIPHETTEPPKEGTEQPPHDPTQVTDGQTLLPTLHGCEKLQNVCHTPEPGSSTLLPNPADCGSYCACTNGEMYYMQCPTGLYFNPVLHVCDWPESSGCTSNGTEDPPSETTQPPTGTMDHSPTKTNIAPETTTLQTNLPYNTTDTQEEETKETPYDSTPVEPTLPPDFSGCQKVKNLCPDPEHQNATLLPNPDECESYCVCNSGDIYLMPCPTGLYFNPVLKVCDWPESSGCSSNGTVNPPSGITDSSSPVTNDPTPPPSPNGCLKVQHLCPDPEHQNATLLPNPDDCESYCVCNNGDIYLMHCPTGLYFNPVLRVCDWPESSGCPTNGTENPPNGTTESSPPVTNDPTPPPSPNGCLKVQHLCPDPEHQNATLLPNPDDCESYCVCNNGDIYLMLCPTGLYFNPVLNVCDWPESSGCPTNDTENPPSGTTDSIPPITDGSTLPPSPNGCLKIQHLCPDPEHQNATLLPNPDECESYCACSNGDIYLMQCPTGLYFNPVLHVCDWPESSGCPSNGTVHPPSGSTGPPTIEGDGTTLPPETNGCPKIQHWCPASNHQNATLFPNPNDCGSYCVCNDGYIHHMLCPAGLDFHPILRVCDWPSDVGCTPIDPDQGPPLS